MMQSYASVGEAPRRQAHSVPRLRSHGGLRVTATSDRCRQFAAAGSKLCELRMYLYLYCAVQADTGRRVAPAGTSPVVT
jgi:hypothetical protein